MSPVLTLLILSCSVAADATAVAIAASVAGITLKRGLLLAFFFGSAQAAMAGIGWLGGATLGQLWSDWDHWIALILLSAVGLNMIREAFGDEERQPLFTRPLTLLMLSLATSIDALAVGVSLPTLKTSAAVALTMIGAVTFLFTFAGSALGRFLGQRFGRVVEVAGGLGLIAIGISIVVDHVVSPYNG